MVPEYSALKSYYVDRDGDPLHASHKGKATCDGSDFRLECSCGFLAHGILNVYGDDRIQISILILHSHRLEMLEARLDLKLAEVLEKMKWSDPETSERVDTDFGRE